MNAFKVHFSPKLLQTVHEHHAYLSSMQIRRVESTDALQVNLRLDSARSMHTAQEWCVYCRLES